MGRRSKTPKVVKDSVIFSSTATGAVAGGKTGAEIGAAAGTMCCPGAGTAVGAGIGTVIGALAGYGAGTLVVDQMEDMDSKKGRY